MRADHSVPNLAAIPGNLCKSAGFLEGRDAEFSNFVPISAKLACAGTSFQLNFIALFGLLLYHEVVLLTTNYYYYYYAFFIIY